MPDGMVVDPKVIEDINKEVKSLGDNTKKMQESMSTDLGALRALVEEHKTAIGPEVKAQIDALSASVIEKHTKLEKLMGDRLSTVETKVNRTGFGSGGQTDQETATRSSARDFHMMCLASRGQLKVDHMITDEEVDFAAIENYNKIYATYLRRDERGVETKALQVGSDPDGGYWVTPKMSARIITRVYETSPLRQFATVERISTDALEIPNDMGEFDAGWVGEQEARPETATSGTGVQRIPAMEMYAMPSATQKLLEDASIDVEAWIAGKIGDKFGRLESTAFMLGNGIKQPRGLLTYPNGTNLPGQIEQVKSGDATKLTPDGLIALVYTLKEPFVGNARFFMRRATVASVLTMKNSAQDYIWRDNFAGDTPALLLGYPVSWAADMPAVAAGALPVAFGDYRQAYTVVDRLGISTLRDPYTKKPFVLFYTRKRVGGDVVNFDAVKLQLIST